MVNWTEERSARSRIAERHLWKRQLANHLIPLLCVTVGIAFVASGSLKVIYWSQFSDALMSYGFLPPLIINSAGLALPWIEITLGLMMMVRWRVSVIAGALATLLLTFTGVTAIAVLQGRSVECGCFPGAMEPVGWGYFFRNGLLILSCFYILASARKQ